MKRLLAILLTLIIFVSLSACNKNQKADATETYTDFLQGEITYLNSEGQKEYVSDLFLFSKDCAYSFYDMNGDSEDELLLKTPGNLYIFTIRDNKIHLWRKEIAYCRPLNDGSILHERENFNGVYAQYIHYKPNFDGSTKEEINFTQWLATSDRHSWVEIDGKEVTLEEFHSLLSPVLKIGDDNIKWELIENNNDVLLTYLEGRRSFIYVGGKMNSQLTLPAFLEKYKSASNYRYTLVDIDNDYQDELIVEYFYYNLSYIIIDYEKDSGKFYAYDLPIDSPTLLKADGRVLVDGTTTSKEIIKFNLSGEETRGYDTHASFDFYSKKYYIKRHGYVEEEEILNYFHEFYSSPDVEWVEVK